MKRTKTHKMTKYLVQLEVTKRINEALKIGRFATQAQRVSSLFGALMKTYYLSGNRPITLRAYLIKYHKDEYRHYVLSIKSQNTKGGFFTQCKGINLDVFNYNHERYNGDHVYQSFDGRLPFKKPY